MSFLSVFICVNLWLINILQYLDRRIPSARAHDAAEEWPQMNTDYTDMKETKLSGAVHICVYLCKSVAN